MNDERPSCNNCEYYENFMEHCRRYPRQVVTQGLDGHQHSTYAHEFPKMGSGEWCGEYNEWVPIKHRVKARNPND